MTRRSRRAAGLAAALVLPAVLLLAGCSSAALDVPDEAPPVATPVETVAPSTDPTAGEGAPTPGAADVESLDCAAVLPITSIEAVLELPAGFVTTSEQGSGCAWAMAGNPAALVLQTATGDVAGAFEAQESVGSAVPSDLGDDAFFRAGDPAVDPAATLVVLAGDRLLSIRSAVGGQAALESLATEVLTALEQESL
ncbi:hypothetical protein HQQ82_06260 [Rathayibacter sp. VKM Ac-2856]|uniref:hypothetical protein n=1 Tax=unclassified Rathayibacter TaxID=2609250 RepID=UPI001566DB69|nr:MULTISPECIES: hypothetical protein [unclassified Rathayibacter]NQX04401.1 hypothetical protein [Rathayibacter sp. VKM Ac-2858]NQX19570.1 hypothetical protein [Rathayibacter sp. VKM Ac-2856]